MGVGKMKAVMKDRHLDSYRKRAVEDQKRTRKTKNLLDYYILALL